MVLSPVLHHASKHYLPTGKPKVSFSGEHSPPQVHSRSCWRQLCYTRPLSLQLLRNLILIKCCLMVAEPQNTLLIHYIRQQCCFGNTKCQSKHIRESPTQLYTYIHLYTYMYIPCFHQNSGYINSLSETSICVAALQEKKHLYPF